MRIKTILIISCFLLITIAAFTFVSQSTSEIKTNKNDEKIAVVNGVALSKAFFDYDMDTVQKKYKRIGQILSEEQNQKLEKEILDNMITAELLFQEGTKQNVLIDQKTIDQEVSIFKSRFKKKTELKETLRRLHLDEAGLEKRAHKVLVANKVVENITEEFTRKITVSDKECEEYYSANPDKFQHPEQVRASHILLSVQSDADEKERKKLREKLEKIRQELKDGADFSVLARKHSQCPSKDDGGDLKYFSRGEMVEPFEKVAFELEIGKISDIVETSFGFHVLKVTAKRPKGLTPFEEEKEKIMGFLKQEKVNKSVIEYIDNLKSNAKIEKNEPFNDSVVAN